MKSKKLTFLCISFAVLLTLVLLTLAHQPIGVALDNPSAAPMSVTFMDVGHGDSCWLHLPNGEDVLVDGGGSQTGPTVVAYLDEHGVTDIELMVATHGDADHIGGLIDVLASMPVAEAWLDSQTCTTITCQEFYQALADNDVVTTTVRMGENYSWGEVTALVLNPSEPLYAEKNENSVVLRVSYGSVDFLLTGDVETGAENRMLNSGLPLEAEILKVAHHGSSSSSSPDFLSAVSPEVAIISVGPNSWGHPTEQTLARLQAVGATIYRTDQQGIIVVTSDGNTYSVSIDCILPGDLDGDGDVDVEDIMLVANCWRMTNEDPDCAPYDLDGSGIITVVDIMLVAAHWGETCTTPTPTPTTTPSPTPTEAPVNNLIIADIRYDTSDEYIEIENLDAASQNMTGWKIQSYKNINGGCEPTDQWYTFPSGYVLDAGASVRIHSGRDAHDNPPSDLLWTTQYIWHNDGDKAILYDAAGSVIHTYDYGECCP